MKWQSFIGTDKKIVLLNSVGSSVYLLHKSRYISKTFNEFNKSMLRRHGVHILNSLNELSFISIKNIAYRFSYIVIFSVFVIQQLLRTSSNYEECIAIYQFAKQMSGNPAI